MLLSGVIEGYISIIKKSPVSVDAIIKVSVEISTLEESLTTILSGFTGAKFKIMSEVALNANITITGIMQITAIKNFFILKRAFLESAHNFSGFLCIHAKSAKSKQIALFPSLSFGYLR